MGRKKKEDEAKKEKPIFGSGAEPQPVPKDDGLVRCVCTVPCAWMGYHDEGDTVWVYKELIEKDAFIRMHFEEVKSEELGVKSSDNADGADWNENSENDNGNGKSDNADGGSDNADGADGNGEGQGELDLK